MYCSKSIRPFCRIGVSVLFACLASFGAVQAQEGTEVGAQIAKATEFTIPVSPAFDLIGVNPAQVTKPSNIREFKVDWSFRSWRLKPNLALQAQPIWEIAYNRADLTRYQKASRFLKTLSTLDISAGTVEDDNQIRRVSFAAKINLYRQHDPLENAELFEGIDTSFRREQMERMGEINRLNALIDHRKRRKQASPEMTATRDSLETEHGLAAADHKVKIQEIAQTFLKSHWNAAHLDVAYGRVFSYDRPRLDSLGLQAQAQAVWANGSVGIGKKVLLTGLVRYILQERDSSTPVDSSSNVLSLGFNFRYGSPKFNFFAEVVYSNGSKAFALSDATLNITQLAPLSLSYGGDWRINRNVVLSYGVRTDYSSGGFKFRNLIPVAGVSCMMR